MHKFSVCHTFCQTPLLHSWLNPDCDCTMYIYLCTMYCPCTSSSVCAAQEVLVLSCPSVLQQKYSAD